MTTIQIPALGRLFKLGLFYDSRKDELLEDEELWSPDELQNHTVELTKPESEYSFTAKDSLHEKTSLLKIDTHTKLSYICGVMKVGGAAKYLEDRKQFTRQSRVSFKYRCTTHFKELLLDNLLKTSMPKLLNFDKSKATHIVVGILYGAESIFLFDKEISDNDDVKDSNNKLEAKVLWLPKLSRGGALSQDDTNEGLNNIRCTFYGDLTLEKNPTTFEEAVNVFKTLPSRICNEKESTVPVTIWLYPLAKLINQAATVENKVDVAMVNKIEERRENQALLRMKCNDLLAKPASKYSEDFKNKVEKLREDISDSEKVLVEKLSETLLYVRQNSVSSSLQIDNTLEEHQESVINFNKKQSNYTQMEKPLTAVIQKYQTILHDIHQNEQEPIVHIKLPESLDKPENFLKEMRNVMKSTAEILSESPDLSSKEFSLNINVSPENNEVSASVGHSEVDSFIPDPPGKPCKLDTSAHSITLTWNPPRVRNQSVKGYMIFYTVFSSDDWQSQKLGDINECGIANLEEDTSYIFRVKCIYTSAISRYSETSDLIRTKTSFEMEYQNDQDRLRKYSSGLQSKIQVCLNGLAACRQQYQTLQAQAENISANESISYDVSEIRTRQEERKDMIPSTYCTFCQVVCHENCHIPMDSDKRGCAVMDSNGYCKVCQHRCSWLSHTNPAFQSVPEMVKVTEVLTQKKFDALEDELTCKQVKALDTIRKSTNEMNRMREQSKFSHGRMSVQNFIDNMISVEEIGQELGYQERIQELKFLRDEEQIDEAERLYYSKEELKRSRQRPDNSDQTCCLI